MQHFDESLSLTSLAASASVHPVHLARSFRRHFGCTVGDLVRERRVEDAKTRIRNGAELSVVAEEAGFADQSHLGRTFRSLTGMTPGRYRRANPVPKR